jgi:hypothetical protein
MAKLIMLYSNEPFLIIVFMSLQVDIIVTGIDELVNAAGMFAAKLESDVIPSWIDQTGNYLLTVMKNRMHQQTGRMKATTKLQKVSNTESMVVVPVPYAMAENRRPGNKIGEGTPHRFLEPSVQETMNKQTPQFVAQTIIAVQEAFNISGRPTFFRG